MNLAVHPTAEITLEYTSSARSHHKQCTRNSYCTDSFGVAFNAYTNTLQNHNITFILKVNIAQ